ADETHAAQVRGVGLGAVDEQHVVQGNLAGLQFDGDGFALVDLDGDFLPTGEQVVLGEGVAVGNLRLPVRARDDLHGAIGGDGGGEGDPSGDDVAFVQAPVGCVLMPRDVGGVARLLDEKARG